MNVELYFHIRSLLFPFHFVYLLNRLELCVLCSTHAVDVFISFNFCFISGITKSFLRLHNSVISLGILLIIFLSHVSIIVIITDVFRFDCL
jgi:hypothetical protein